jgi:acyl-[acyl carrier protein]--UDP-N-acetylglucosamine O-acyltransferase
MTSDWTIIYKALYKSGKKTKDDIKAVKKTKLTDKEQEEIVKFIS